MLIEYQGRLVEHRGPPCLSCRWEHEKYDPLIEQFHKAGIFTSQEYYQHTFIEAQYGIELEELHGLPRST